MPSVTANRIGSSFRSVWQAVLYVCPFLLCVRFLTASLRQTYPEFGAALLLIIGSMALGTWRPRAALFAFICAVPLLNGLGYVGLGSIPLPPSLAFSALFIGISCRCAFHDRKALAEQKSGCPSQKEAEETMNRDWAATEAPTLVTNILITVILVSLTGQMIRHLGDVAFWTKFWSQPVFGYSDPLYFVSSAFVWMQGLILLRLLIGKHGLCDPVTKIENFGGLDRRVASRARDDKLGCDGRALVAWSRSALLAWALGLLSFAIIQRQWELPEKYAGFMYTSPFEDIHSLGAITVTSLAFFLAAFRFTPVWRAIGLTLPVLGLLALTILSWSRATWLAAFGTIVLLALIHFSWKWRGAIVLAGVGLLIAVNQAAKSSAWQNDSYLWRLGNLVRLESPMQKDPSRMYLYHKALRMIHERSVTGHGIGSFYLKSTSYGEAGDPYATEPNFAHNFFLQFAAELGVPAALLLGGLIALALIRGYRSSLQRDRIPRGDLTVFSLTMALTAYLITQMTANALNIYVSNQFMFEFLIATLLTQSHNRYNFMDSMMRENEAAIRRNMRAAP